MIFACCPAPHTPAAMRNLASMSLFQAVDLQSDLLPHSIAALSCHAPRSRPLQDRPPSHLTYPAHTCMSKSPWPLRPS